MSILESVLAVLSGESNGSLPASEVKERVRERITNPKRLAEDMRIARENLRLGLSLRERTARPQMIFGDLIDERHGVWAITEAGRSYLHTLGIQQNNDEH